MAEEFPVAIGIRAKDDGASETIKRVSSEMSKMMALAAGFGSALGSAAVDAAKKLGEMAVEAVNVRVELEKTEVQLASMIEAFKKHSGGVGEASKAHSSWGESMETSEKLMENFERLAVKSGGTAKGYAETVKTLGLTMHGTADEMSKLAEKMELIGKATGDGAQGLAFRINRMAMSGTSMNRSAADQILRAQFGLDPKEMMKLYYSDLDAFREYVTTHMSISSDQKATIVNTWESLRQEIAAAQERNTNTMGKAMEPLKVILSEARDMIGSDEANAMFSRLGETVSVVIKILWEATVAVLDFLKALGGLRLMQAIVNVLAIFADGLQVIVRVTLIAVNGISQLVEAIKWLWATMSGSKDADLYLKRMEELHKKNVQLLEDTVKSHKTLTGQNPEMAKGPSGIIGADSALPATAQELESILLRIKNLRTQIQDNIRSALAWTDEEKADARIDKTIDSVKRSIEALQLQIRNDPKLGTPAVIAGVNALVASLKPMRKALEEAFGRDEYEKIQRFFVALAEGAATTAQQFASAAWQKANEEMRQMTENYLRMKSMMTPAEQARAESMLESRRSKIATEQSSGFFDREGLKKEAEWLYKTLGDAVSDGVAVGEKKILAGFKSTGQLVADYTMQLWDALGTGFSDLFVGVLKGNLDDIKNAFKSLFDSVLKAFGDFLSKMVQKWLAANLFGTSDVSNTPGTISAGQSTQVVANAMKEAQRNGVVTASENVSAKAPSILESLGGWGSILGSLGVAYGAGGFGQQQGGNAGAATGRMIGAVGGLIGGGALVATGVISGTILGAEAGSVVPVIGTIIGAIIGAILGSLLQGSTEQSVGVYSAGQHKDTPAGSAVLQKYGQTLGGLQGVMRAGGDKGNMKALIQRMMTRVPQSITIAAGSPEDIQGNFARYISELYPQILYSIAMGRKQSGNKDFGTSLQGIPNFTGGSVEDTPLTDMLKSIGFSAAAVDEIAKQIDARSADEWLAWLTKMVTVVKGFNDLEKNFRQTRDQIFEGFKSSDSKKLGDVFKDANKDILDLTSTLGDLVGDEQLSRAEEILRLSQQQYDAELQALRQIYDLINDIKATTSSTVAQVQYQRMTAGQQESELRSRIWNKRTEIENTKNPAEIAKLWPQLQQSYSELFNMLLQKITALKTVIASIKDLREQIQKGPGDDINADIVGYIFGKGAKEMEKWQGILNDPSSSVETQLDAAQHLQQISAERYNAEIQAVQQIKSLITQIHDSIEQQKFGMSLDMAGSPAGRADLLWSRLQDLQARLAGAKSPGEVNSLTTQIQAIVQQLWNLYPEGDSHRAEVQSKLTGVLDNVDRVSTELLAHFQDLLEQDITRIGVALAAAEDRLGTALDQANLDLDGLIAEYTWVSGKVVESLNGMADEVTAAVAELVTAMDTARSAFTNMGAVLTGAGTGGGGGGGGGTGGGGDTQLPVNDALINLGLAASAATLGIQSMTAGGPGGTNTPGGPGGGGEVNNVNVTVYATTGADPEEIGNVVAYQVFEALRRTPEVAQSRIGVA